ncbi:MAG TPA: hypothetical protein VD971_04760 [Phycisphaerales bacterium]|nr:hypothetical protein [Phycisphaerales bacterium]
MTVKAITISGPSDAIAELERALRSMEVSVSAAAPYESPSAALHSPLTGEEVRATLEFLTVLLMTAQTWAAIQSVLDSRAKESKAELTIRDATSQQVLGSVSPERSATQIQMRLP